MPSSIPNIIADFSTILALKTAIGDTTATLVSATDSDGVALPTGTYGFTIDRNNANKEYITCTLTGTALTNVYTIAVGTGVATSGFAKAHRRSAEVIITDFVVIKRLQDIFETGYPSATTPTTNYQLATKKYVDDIALGGTTTVDKVTIVATCGENVVAGNLLYLKLSDSKWWKCDADTVATIDNVVLAIAQGSGTANGLITGGVLIKGVDANQSGLTPNSIYYASNTAGGVSATSGTITKIIGIATSTTDILFDPDFNKTYKNYAVDAAGSDTYAITLQSAFGAYYSGMEVTFKAGTANTGACTLNVNGLGAKDIRKDVSVALTTGDILANQIVKVIYDGTNFQLVSNLSNVPVVRTYLNAGSPATWTKPSGLKYVVVEVQAGGGGGGGTTTDDEAAGGGGGGGYSRRLIPTATLGSTETVTTGAGGTAGAAAGGTGGTGGSSSFGTLATATGGVGGVGTSPFAGGAGGIGSSGDINLEGTDGGTGLFASTNRVLAGHGGSSHLGGGAASLYPGSGTDSNGINGNVYGGGASGGASAAGGDATGGVGGAGIVIVTEFY